jgi:hypothetical protein
MARQVGEIKITGRLGGVTFYYTKTDGYLARVTNGIDRKRIYNEPNFVLTRQNYSEFGRACFAGKVLRMAMRPKVVPLMNKRMVNRTSPVMMKVIQSDSTHPRGQRMVNQGDVALFTGFEFNNTRRLADTFNAPFSTQIDRLNGTFSAAVPAFVPGEMIAAPENATHCRLGIIGAEIDFEKHKFTSAHSTSHEIALGTQAQADLSLHIKIKINGSYPLFLAFGIEFLKQEKDCFLPLNKDHDNVLTLARVEGSQDQHVSNSKPAQQ